MTNKDNLARQIQTTPDYFQPQIKEKSYESAPSTKKKKIFTGVETFVISIFASLALLALLVIITMSNTNSNLNRQIQELNQETQQAQTVNENLDQNVQELSRYDRVYEIARKNGLELNEENIRNVAP